MRCMLALSACKPERVVNYGTNRLFLFFVYLFLNIFKTPFVAHLWWCHIHKLLNMLLVICSICAYMQISPIRRLVFLFFSLRGSCPSVNDFILVAQISVLMDAAKLKIKKSIINTFCAMTSVCSAYWKNADLWYGDCRALKKLMQISLSG